MIVIISALGKDDFERGDGKTKIDSTKDTVILKSYFELSEQRFSEKVGIIKSLTPFFMSGHWQHLSFQSSTPPHTPGTLGKETYAFLLSS